MNVEEVKLREPSLPLDVHWDHFAYSRFLERHPSYSVSEGDILIFLIGHFPRELTANKKQRSPKVKSVQNSILQTVAIMNSV